MVGSAPEPTLAPENERIRPGRLRGRAVQAKAPSSQGYLDQHLGELGNLGQGQLKITARERSSRPTAATTAVIR